ncbi:hypothetical protein J2Z83_003763 [Virgibacillus natechei]|uniref:Uncharacterized protein n=1 Tax=Virgibacillus natechei TaxID=1216297 RepID=A0ABS4IKX2_9BACI|nr:hypothetical protein [Virgibacillus natechei]
MKIFVRETTTKTADGDKLTRIETFNSKVDNFSYILRL